MLYLRKRRLKKQIEDFVLWKMNHSDVAYVTDREFLLKFFKLTKAIDVCDIKHSDVGDFVECVWRETSAGYYNNSAKKSLRCFLRYYKARGYPVLVDFDKILK